MECPCTIGTAGFGALAKRLGSRGQKAQAKTAAAETKRTTRPTRTCISALVGWKKLRLLWRCVDIQTVRRAAGKPAMARMMADWIVHAGQLNADAAVAVTCTASQAMAA